jgi:purine-binding chemotaxis protein CheW
MNAMPRTGSGLKLAPLTAAVPAEPTQYLTFSVGGELFGLGILAVKEIIEYQRLTEVPMMPEAIRGVINLRGSVVPVMDLTARFGRPRAELTKRTCIVIAEAELVGERQVVGVMVDAVSQVLDISAQDIEPAPSFGTKIRSDFIQGIGKVEGEFVVLLNIDRVLTIEEAGALAELSRHGL